MIKQKFEKTLSIKLVTFSLFLMYGSAPLALAAPSNTNKCVGYYRDSFSKEIQLTRPLQSVSNRYRYSKDANRRLVSLFAGDNYKNNAPSERNSSFVFISEYGRKALLREVSSGVKIYIEENIKLASKPALQSYRLIVEKNFGLQKVKKELEFTKDQYPFLFDEIDPTPTQTQDIEKFIESAINEIRPPKFYKLVKGAVSTIFPREFKIDLRSNLFFVNMADFKRSDEIDFSFSKIYDSELAHDKFYLRESNNKLQLRIEKLDDQYRLIIHTDSLIYNPGKSLTVIVALKMDDFSFLEKNQNPNENDYAKLIEILRQEVYQFRYDPQIPYLGRENLRLMELKKFNENERPIANVFEPLGLHIRGYYHKKTHENFIYSHYDQISLHYEKRDNKRFLIAKRNGFIDLNKKVEIPVELGESQLEFIENEVNLSKRDFKELDDFLVESVLPQFRQYIAKAIIKDIEKVKKYANILKIKELTDTEKSANGVDEDFMSVPIIRIIYKSDDPNSQEYKDIYIGNRRMFYTVTKETRHDQNSQWSIKWRSRRPNPGISFYTYSTFHRFDLFTSRFNKENVTNIFSFDTKD